MFYSDVPTHQTLEVGVRPVNSVGPIEPCPQCLASSACMAGAVWPRKIKATKINFKKNLTLGVFLEETMNEVSSILPECLWNYHNFLPAKIWDNCPKSVWVKRIIY